MISHNRLLRDTFVPSSELSTVPRIYDLSPFFFDIFEKASRGDRSITIHDIYYIYIRLVTREREIKKFLCASRHYRGGTPKQIFDSRLYRSP